MLGIEVMGQLIALFKVQQKMTLAIITCAVIYER